MGPRKRRPSRPSADHPETTVVPLQNGIDDRERLGAILGLDRVVIGTAFINAFIGEPGVIEQRIPFNHLAFGEWDGRAGAPQRRTASVLIRDLWCSVPPSIMLSPVQPSRVNLSGTCESRGGGIRRNFVSIGWLLPMRRDEGSGFWSTQAPGCFLMNCRRQGHLR